MLTPFAVTRFIGSLEATRRPKPHKCGYYERLLRRLASATIVLLLLTWIRPAVADSPSGRVEVEPKNVEIGIFYSGQDIRVTASAPAGDEIVMRLTGPEEPLVLKRKGKKYGILWMNVGEVHYEAVPTLYLLESSQKLDEMAGPETLARLKLGFDALRDQVSAESDAAAKELFSELLKLKQKDHLFSATTGDVDMVAADAGRQRATGRFLLPARAPVGEYTVDVFGFHNHQAALLGTAAIHLRRDAVVSTITSLATNHGLLYGCLAVAVAVLAGLFTGFVFRR